jgi:hypothetical protein
MMMNTKDELKFDFLDHVVDMKSAIGIYLRREVFKKESRTDPILKKKLYEQTVADQSADGSWNQLFVQTANNLWNLALLGCDAKDRSVKKGLEWLLSIQRQSYRGYPGFFLSSNRKDPSLMRSTLYGEFGPGCTICYQTTYAVHLFHIFGFGNTSQVKTAVNSYLQFWRPNWCGTWCNLNVLRMLIEHPLSRESKQVKDGLEYFAKKQTKTGAWKAYPFYHTFHALSRVKHVMAKEQLEKAFPLIIKRQNKDGSWGRKEHETITFLVLDALKNAAII